MNRPKSAVVIARLLDTEGFTDHTAARVRQYALKIATPQQRKRWARTKKAFSEMVKTKLSDADRLVLGKMMSIYAAMNFNTGLRIGLTAMAVENNKMIEGDL